MGGNNSFVAISGNDDQFAYILRAFSEMRPKEDSIITFTADYNEKWVLMGNTIHKVVWYDESLLNPFIIQCPGIIEPGEDDLLMGVSDLMLTLMNYSGINGLPVKAERTDQAFLLTTGEEEKPPFAFWLFRYWQIRSYQTSDHTMVIQWKVGRESVWIFNRSEDTS